MTLFGLCKTMAELTAEKFIVPVMIDAKDHLKKIS